MILPLRKRHLYIWIVLGILLPVGYFTAYMSMPGYPAESKEELNFGIVAALPNVVATQTTNSLEVNLRDGNASSQKQLENKVNRPVKNPAATIYLGQQQIERPEQGVLLGLVGPVGTQRINLDSTLSSYSSYHLLIYDPIQKEIIEQISL